MGWSWFCGWWVTKLVLDINKIICIATTRTIHLFLWSGDMFTVLEMTVWHCLTKFWKWLANFRVYDQTWWPNISPAHLELSSSRYCQSKVAYMNLKIFSWFIKQKYKSNLCTLYYQCIIYVTPSLIWPVNKNSLSWDFTYFWCTTCKELKLIKFVNVQLKGRFESTYILWRKINNNYYLLFPALCLQCFRKERLSNRIILFRLAHCQSKKLNLEVLNYFHLKGLIGCMKEA